MRAVLVADRADRDPGLLGDFLLEAGIPTRYVDRDLLYDADIAADLLILLGSNRSAHDPANAPVVAAEVSLIRRALGNGIPVAGICYGAQVLARALGGSSARGEIPERGWSLVMSDDDPLCPAGYWAQMHHDVFIPSPTSKVIGWSAAGPQAFVDDSLGARAIGWQFHPELVVETLERWLRQGYSGSEGADSESVLADARRHSEFATARAGTLFRSALQYLDVANHVLGVD